MKNIFIFHRDLRLYDNTALIKQTKLYNNVTPIFIFTPEQINKNINKYFSNNSVQFMIESLNELNNEIEKIGGKLHFFHDNYINVLIKLHKLYKINSIAFNLDYTPYSTKRDNEIIKFANKNKINIITTEDYCLYDIINGQTKSTISNNPYTIFTAFKKHCMKNLTIRKPDKFNNFKFINLKEYDIININNFYINNEFINTHGGRKNGLKILNNINKFKNYNQCRDTLTYNTTNLSAYLHFCVLSPREVYYKILNSLGDETLLINELHWRDFYINITYYFPHVLQHKSFKIKYDDIEWDNNKTYFNAWCNGETGFPIIDAAMKQLNTTGFMHNRCRMIVASFLVKDLHIDWKLGEKYFASKLVDYSPMQNNGGWQWCASCGCDAQPYFRIFNPWLQSKKYDKECKYIKKWIPELNNVPNKNIHMWYKFYDDNYIKPIINHSEEIKKTLKIYKKII